ncbi:MAG: hypothetical protein ACRBBP_06305 [Bdellovibrionales bacterium]
MSLAINILLFISFSFGAFAASKGTVAGNLIQDVELRTQYNFDDEEFNNTLRFQLGSLKSGATNKLLNMSEEEERAQILYLTAENKIFGSYRNSKVEIAKNWKKDLVNAYSAYNEYLKSHPSAARSSIDIDVNEVLVQAESKASSDKKIQLGVAFKKDLNEAKLLKAVNDRANTGVSLVADEQNSKSGIIKFLELGVRGSYQDSSENNTVARLGISLPLGFTGQRVEAKNKMALEQYKIKKNKAQSELSLKQAFDELKFKKKLYNKLKSKFLSRSQVRRMISSTSTGAEEKIKIYLDAVKISYKLLELKAEGALLYNRIKLLAVKTGKSEFIGLE